MEKINLKNLKAFSILFVISIFLALVLTFITKTNTSLFFKLSNNLFIIAVFYLGIGVLFQVFNFGLKRRLKALKSKKTKQIDFKEQKRLEIWEYKKSIYGSLWKIFIVVAVVDIGLSFIISIFV